MTSSYDGKLVVFHAKRECKVPLLWLNVTQFSFQQLQQLSCVSSRVVRLTKIGHSRFAGNNRNKKWLFPFPREQQNKRKAVKKPNGNLQQ